MSMYRTTVRHARLPLLCALATAIVAGGCGGGSDSPTGGTGTVRVSLTDAPACGYDAVNVTVSKVRIHRSESAADDDGAWSEIDVAPSRKIDLLDLQNGVLESLGDVQLEAGRYSQVRLVLQTNGAGAPSNSIVLSGDPSKAEIALRTPSAQQSGLKLVHGFEVAAGQTMDLILDFDACRSVVKAGNSGNYNLKPVISVIPVAAVGKLAIDGSLGEPGAGAVVTAQGRDSDGHPVILRATTADDAGAFSLSPLPPSASGDYALVIVKPGHATVVVRSVPAAAGAATIIPPIDMVPATDATLSGEVTMPQPLAEQVVRIRALRTVESLPMEVASTTAAQGPYSMTLSTAPARVATYAADKLSFSDAADPAAYEIEAGLDESGLPLQKASVPLDGPGDVTQDFDFAMP